MVYDNIADIGVNVNNWEDFKKTLTDYLNTNPLINMYDNRQYAIKKFLANDNLEIPL